MFGSDIDAVRFLAGDPDRDRIDSFRNRRLRDLVSHAFDSVPFYQRRWRKHGFDPASFHGIEDLRRLPIVERTELKQAGEDAVARGVDVGKLKIYRTSGSTGKPAVIRRTRFEDRWLQLLRLRKSMRSYGLRLTDRRCGVRLASVSDERHFAMKLGILPQRIIDCRRPAGEIAEEIQRIDPHLLFGYPSSLAEALAEVRRRSLPLDRLRLIVAGGETVTPAVRNRLERLAGGAAVYSTYGAHEVNLIAQDCAAGCSLHVAEEAVVLEVLRPDGSPAAPGETGEAVVTALHSFAMPFIRYRLGDVVCRSRGRCACGVDGERLDSVLGRTLDLFVAPDGGRYHPYAISRPATVLGANHVEALRIVQHAPQRIEVLVQAPNGLPSEYAARLAHEAEAAVGAPLSIEVRRVDDLIIEDNGKFRPYVCLVK